MNPKEIGFRAIRKTSHIANRILTKAEKVTAKIENKTTNIIMGSDFSTGALQEIQFEKIYYNGIEHNLCPLNPALPAVGREGAVVLLIPSLTKSSFYGGTATALIVAGLLAQKSNKKLRIYETLQPGGKEGIDIFYKKYNIGIREKDIELIDVSSRKYNIYGYIDLHPEDIHIASAWWDAYILDKLPLNKKFIYLIQDYEPIFYANSDEFLLAENTYHSDKFIPLCNTKIMLDFMSERYPYIKRTGLYFEPAISQSESGFSEENKVKKRIFLYGRPNVKRNLFYTSINALNTVFSKELLSPSDWEIFMAGQDKIPNIKLSSGIIIQNLGKMNIEEYYKFAKTIDLTISLMMAPHPNYPTLEMSSIGSAVVTTKYANKINLSKYSNNILMADLTEVDIIDKIIAASKITFKQRIKNAQQSQISSDWNLVLEKNVDIIINSF